MTASNGFLNNGSGAVTEVDHPEDEVAYSVSLMMPHWETKGRPVADYNPLLK